MKTPQRPQRPKDVTRSSSSQPAAVTTPAATPAAHQVVRVTAPRLTPAQRADLIQRGRRAEHSAVVEVCQILGLPLDGWLRLDLHVRKIALSTAHPGRFLLAITFATEGGDRTIFSTTSVEDILHLVNTEEPL